MEDSFLAGRGRRLFVLAFVADDEMRDVLLAKNLHQFFVDRCHAFSGIEDENGDIRLVQDAARPLDSEFAQVARVVKARRVNEEDGAERKKFHRFRYRVGRRTLFGGDDGDFLSRDGIDEAGFPGIAAAEKADVQAFARGCVVKSHEKFLSIRGCSICPSGTAWRRAPVRRRCRRHSVG